MQKLNKLTSLNMSYSLKDIEGIGAVYAKKMAKAGVRTTGSLLKRAATPKGRKMVAEKTGFSEKTILEWANRADLMRVRGVAEEYSDLLECAGVDTVKELATRNVPSLVKAMETANKKKKVVRRLPVESQVKKWCAHAKKLKPMLKY